MRFDKRMNSLIILGAGPAGCALALRARQAGLSVRIFEAKSGPKAAPGETLHPGAEPLLKQLGIWTELVKTDFHRHHGVWLEKNGNREFVPYGADEQGCWMGLQMERQWFHKILQQTVEDSGAVLCRGQRPQELIIKNGRVCGVLSEGKEYYAAWTVDATGRSAWLAQKLMLTTKFYSPPLSVRFGWHATASDELEGHPLFSFNDNGWTWWAQIREDCTAWVTLKIRQLGEDLEGLDQTWYCRSACIGSGYALVGDAAAQLDPSSSHGILNAMTAGIYLGHLMEAKENDKITESQVITTYQSWIFKRFIEDKNRLSDHYLSSFASRAFVAASQSYPGMKTE